MAKAVRRELHLVDSAQPLEGQLVGVKRGALGKPQTTTSRASRGSTTGFGRRGVRLERPERVRSEKSAARSACRSPRDRAAARSSSEGLFASWYEGGLAALKRLRGCRCLRRSTATPRRGQRASAAGSQGASHSIRRIPE